MPPAYLAKKLTRPLPIKGGGVLRTIAWKLGVDQQVMMTRIGAIEASGCNPHLVQTEADIDFCRNSIASTGSSAP